MKVIVDHDKCCGAGNCVLSAPEVFDQSDQDGTVLLLDPEPAEEHRSAVEDAVTACPGTAISVIDA
ncbi:ferredoxin [Streptomyces sp. AS58]|uniref:Ferredoxin n=1 Tax=Streptomyces cadmiisoli TaxID=2184053 RepID=A0A2Z4J814_9ACTN|nr:MULTISPECIES: ferredoxin [Streptomyces]AWW40818.1 ferredoxin [Streptomyces cadmiisoli]KOV54373.1 ferredoxin [Streptomyces sp. AS58]